MTQINFYADEKENQIINDLSKEWKLSKQETIKKIIRDFQEKKK